MEDVTDFSSVPPEDQGDLRAALIDQIAYLRDEVKALRTVVGRVPDDVQAGRPTPDDLTMKETYGLIATLDDDVRRARLEAMAAGETPTLDLVDDDALAREAGWNEQSMDDVLDAVSDARGRLLDDLRSLSAGDWLQTGTLDGEMLTVYELVHRFARADMERLRTIGIRLHDADLSER